jgi:hypothetical protein
MRILIPTLALLALAACGGWEAQSRKQGVVWSDDGAAIGYVLHDYEFREHFISPGGDLRNRRHQLRSVDPGLTGDRSLGPFFDGLPYVVYYMRSAGYLVVGDEAEPFHIYDLSGALLKTITARDAEPCDAMVGDFLRRSVIPSPDGSRLVTVETRTRCTVDVRFHDGPPGFVAVSDASIPARDFTFLAWLDADRVIVETCDETCGDGHWVVHADGTVERLPAATDGYAPCLWPATSSSAWTADSLGVYVDPDTDAIHVGNVLDDRHVWGVDSLTPDHFRVGCSRLDP